MDEPTPENPTLTLHTERITISGDRYLIYYTFTTSDDREPVPEDQHPE